MSATGELFPHQPEIARYYNHRKKKMLRHSRAGKTVDLWASVAKCSQMVSSPLVMCVEPKKIRRNLKESTNVYVAIPKHNIQHS